MSIFKKHKILHKCCKPVTKLLEHSSLLHNCHCKHTNKQKMVALKYFLNWWYDSLKQK